MSDNVDRSIAGRHIRLDDQGGQVGLQRVVDKQRIDRSAPVERRAEQIYAGLVAERLEREDEVGIHSS